ncbi:hypothetical protein [Vibrio hangzhouensis]|uniref:hypothetical protein n=1 Tax=Vibrio hangzhouensis TaxID=462991 RepID=UPI001C9480A0|nr:hypothetical protein [Vibrio hangzhouensis]MBY6199342.1 hypothetical protein [Vibrio hangzhouensis]
MKRRCHVGAMTLLTTALLLSLALMLALGMYKTSLYEIKRAQNEVESRKAFWLAEGGVECAIAQYYPSKVIPAVVKSCDTSLTVTQAITLDSESGDVVIAALSGDHKVSRRFARGTSNLKSGAIQTSASMKVKTSLAIKTPDPGDHTSGGWECIAFRFKGKLTIEGALTNDGLIHGSDPSEDFISEQDCLREHKSTFNGGCSSSDPRCFGQDFVYDDTLSVFEDFFGIPVSQHDAVRTNGTFTEIDLETNNGDGELKRKNCGQVIVEQLAKGNLHLWLNGSCVISASHLNEIRTLSQASDGITLLIHDGLFVLQGAATIKGVLFHFNPSFTPSPEIWHELNLADSANTHFPDDYGSAAYYQGGSFDITGGAYFDYANVNHLALFRDSLALHYNRDVIVNSSSALASHAWKKGSWRDF